MKYLILLLFPFLISGQAASSEMTERDWNLDYDHAIGLAKKENKNVLVYFTGSDWCPPCKMLKKDLFESEAFGEMADDYVLLFIDMPRNRDLLTASQWTHNQKVIDNYNKKKVFPLLTVLNRKGKALDSYSGYSMTGEIGYHLKFVEKYR